MKNGLTYDEVGNSVIFGEMTTILERYLPEKSISPCLELIKAHRLHLKVVSQRVTRHGDYRKLPDGGHRITVNATENKYRFLITLVHEIAHLIAFEHYGRAIKPHGKEWKHTFKYLMLPMLRPEIFPADLLPLLARHFKNPRASSSTDAYLSIALMRYDTPNQKNCVFELPYGSIFRLYNGKRFKKVAKRTKRYECIEIGTGRVYLFQPNAEVEWLGAGEGQRAYNDKTG
jgi:hypothetical protein